MPQQQEDIRKQHQYFLIQNLLNNYESLTPLINKIFKNMTLHGIYPKSDTEYETYEYILELPNNEMMYFLVTYKQHDEGGVETYLQYDPYRGDGRKSKSKSKSKRKRTRKSKSRRKKT